MTLLFYNIWSRSGWVGQSSMEIQSQAPAGLLAQSQQKMFARVAIIL